MGEACADDVRPWRNWAGNQEVYARCVARPKTLVELTQIVKDVSARRERMRAVATGLSFSDILQTDGTLVVLTSLTEDAPEGTLLPLESELWHQPTPPAPHVRIVAGARIRELNAALDSAGLAFPNLGGYDGQTFVGALSTSTHGSGLAFGPFCDLVRSLDLVSTFGKRYRIEPGRGITHPERFRHRYGAAMTLVQNDDWFHAAVVSLGCLGVIHSVTVEVSAAYDLEEHRRRVPWSQVRAELSSRAPLSAFRNYEVLLNPYRRRDGDYSCLVTERELARPGAERVPLPEARLAAEALTFASTTQRGLLELMNSQPRLIPTILEAGLSQLVTGAEGHVEPSHRIYNIGKINTADVLSGEYFVPLRDDLFLKAVDRLIAVIAGNRRHGIYQTSPLSLRFVKGSPAHLSMVHGAEPFCAIEIPVFAGGAGAFDALLSYEQALYAFGARPHWGQLNELTGAPGWWQRAYPAASRFLEVYRTLNPHGVFDNHFTDRLGLSSAETA